MVKDIDEIEEPWPDHIGWRLWKASHAWQRAFVAEMRRAGHQWFTNARATLMGHIDRRGTRQADLIERLGITKQAVQQLIDGLVAEGVLVRAPDPDDKRGRIIRYTRKGKSALRDADRIKAVVEERYRAALGETRFAALCDALERLPDDTDGEIGKSGA